jgi:hypothetical protein
VHERETEPLVALMVAISPDDPPEVLSVGVLSLVTLSVSDAPVSDEASRSGANGTSGAVGSITRLVVSLGMERLPEGSVSVPVTLHDPGVNDESVHDVAEPIS